MTAHDVGAMVLLIVMVTWGIASWITDVVEGIDDDD